MKSVISPIKETKIKASANVITKEELKELIAKIGKEEKKEG